MPQVDVFLDVVAKNADFFRKIMLKYGEVGSGLKPTCADLGLRFHTTTALTNHNKTGERRVEYFRSLLLAHVQQVQACDAQM